MKKKIESWVSEVQPVVKLDKLPGDASTRQYFRVETEDSSYVAMVVEPFEDEGKKYPFLAVQKHLDSVGVDVPQIIKKDSAKGFILLEDLGDATLLRRLQTVSDTEVERHLYERVLDQLVHLQIHASPKGKSRKLDAFNLFFSKEKLMWEVNFTIEHFYQKHLGRTIKAQDKKIMESGFSEICEILSEEVPVFTHRDFHSRNIMVVPKKKDEEEDRFVMIDFQDARMGPAQYDLVSLLKDSYYQLEEEQVEKLVDYYIARHDGETGDKIDKKSFYKIFDLMAVQRNFKAIGSFASFLNRRQNPTYLKYIGNTFENIRRTLLKYPRYSSLREVLFHYYYF